MRMAFKLAPRAWLHNLLTYPRFLGTIKPELMKGAVDELPLRLGIYQRSWWPKQLVRPVAKKILAISPHPDDESIGCGGLLLSHAGYSEIRIVSVYNGDGGGALAEGQWRDDPIYKARLASVRSGELDKVAAMVEASEVIRFRISDCDGVPGGSEIVALRRILEDFAPEVVLLPWFLDNHPHHKVTNRIFAEAAKGLDLMVLAYEIWAMLSPNAIFDITDVLGRKREMIAMHASQIRTVDYVQYAEGLARTRAFHYPVRGNRSGAVEAYLALPCADYCDLARRASEGSPGPGSAVRQPALADIVAGRQHRLRA
jgi:LmbE family N-acetylglucosaminyl deacetylase